MRAVEQILKEGREFKDWLKKFEPLKVNLVSKDDETKTEVWADENGNETTFVRGIPMGETQV